jgi:hypothetical protein
MASDLNPHRFLHVLHTSSIEEYDAGTSLLSHNLQAEYHRTITFYSQVFFSKGLSVSYRMHAVPVSSRNETAIKKAAAVASPPITAV